MEAVAASSDIVSSWEQGQKYWPRHQGHDKGASKRAAATPVSQERLARRSREAQEEIEAEPHPLCPVIKHEDKIVLELHVEEHRCCEMMTRLLNDGGLDKFAAILEWDYDRNTGVTIHVSQCDPMQKEELIDFLATNSAEYHEYLESLPRIDMLYPEYWMYRHPVSIPERAPLSDPWYKKTPSKAEGSRSHENDGIQSKGTCKVKEEPRDWQAQNWWQSDNLEQSTGWTSSDTAWQESRSTSRNANQWQEDYKNASSLEELPQREKNKAWRWYAPLIDPAASPEPLRFRKSGQDVRATQSKTIEANAWMAMAASGRESANLGPAEERELIVTSIKVMQEQQELQAKQTEFHQQQIAIAQKQNKAASCRLHGLGWNWPDYDSRVAIRKILLDELQMEARDLVDVEETDNQNNLLPTQILHFRNPGRKQFFLTLMFGPYKQGFEIQGGDYTITLEASSFDVPIEKRSQEVKRALSQTVHEAYSGNQKEISKSWGPDFKLSIKDELIVHATVVQGRFFVYVREDWFTQVNADFPEALLQKSAPRHVKHAHVHASEKERADILREFIQGFPYNFSFCSTKSFDGTPLESYKRRLAEYELMAKGSANNKGRGKGRNGKGKGKGRGKGAHANSGYANY